MVTDLAMDMDMAMDTGVVMVLNLVMEVVMVVVMEVVVGVEDRAMMLVICLDLIGAKSLSQRLMIDFEPVLINN
jgi:hypothetical protein